MTSVVCEHVRAAAAGELHTSNSGDVVRLDSADAEFVERAWKTLPPNHRELLRWHYIRNASPGFICRRLGIKQRPTSVFDIELARSEQAIARVLTDLADRQPSRGRQHAPTGALR
jgi:DNA-directed RNA polymerase specialized sigma24 family protein